MSGKADLFEKTVETDCGDMTAAAVETLIQKVGERVRKAREIKGMPRRVISQISGVSPRYLAQLEAGEGNISIGLLKRVAMALDYPLERLLAEQEPRRVEFEHLMELYQAATPLARTKAIELLTMGTASNDRAQRICLIGLRGAGKSTLGAMMSKTFGLTFIELNREIEKNTGMAVAEVLALYGQEGYRHFETQAIEQVLASHEQVILAVAGGIVSDPDTYQNLLLRFHTVWIKASPNEHMTRVRQQGDMRPMAGKPEAMEELKAILQSREAHYAKATAVLDTSGKALQTSHDELVALVRAHGFLDKP